MSSLEIALRRLCDELVEARFRFALIGGLAVSVRSEPRFIRDVDARFSLERRRRSSIVRAKHYGLLSLEDFIGIVS